MGNRCSSGNQVPPAQTDQMVGTWVSSPAAEKLQPPGIKSGSRYKRGTFTGLEAPAGEWEAVKLVIEDTGRVHYVHINGGGCNGLGVKNYATLIDGPISKMTETEIHMPRGAPPLQYCIDNRTDRLIVNGIGLNRSGTTATLTGDVVGRLVGKEGWKDEGHQESRSATSGGGDEAPPMTFETQNENEKEADKEQEAQGESGGHEQGSEGAGVGAMTPEELKKQRAERKRREFLEKEATDSIDDENAAGTQPQDAVEGDAAALPATDQPPNNSEEGEEEDIVVDEI